MAVSRFTQLEARKCGARHDPLSIRPGPASLRLHPRDRRAASISIPHANGNGNERPNRKQMGNGDAGGYGYDGDPYGSCPLVSP